MHTNVISVRIGKIGHISPACLFISHIMFIPHYRSQSFDALQQHKMFTHTADTFNRPFSCDNCNFQTSTPRALRSHQERTHQQDVDVVSTNDDNNNSNNNAILEQSADIASDVVQVDGESEHADDDRKPAEVQEKLTTESPTAPPPSCCSEPSPTTTDVEADRSEDHSTSLDDDHSQLAAETHSTGYHSMVNYGIV